MSEISFSMSKVLDIAKGRRFGALLLFMGVFVAFIPMFAELGYDDKFNVAHVRIFAILSSKEALISCLAISLLTLFEIIYCSFDGMKIPWKSLNILRIVLLVILISSLLFYAIPEKQINVVPSLVSSLHIACGFTFFFNKTELNKKNVNKRVVDLLFGVFTLSCLLHQYGCIFHKPDIRYISTALCGIGLFIFVSNIIFLGIVKSVNAIDFDFDSTVTLISTGVYLLIFFYVTLTLEDYRTCSSRLFQITIYSNTAIVLLSHIQGLKSVQRDLSIAKVFSIRTCIAYLL